ncbi:cell division protein ZipA [Arsukibacterium sp.]|uniref:cell division protein ZipA n=1 Tax=Arsukibacterium sp. TaxID=1977258 RepID=UPI002FD89C0F
MASELRLVLIILGALILGGLFLHGIWTVRKNSQQSRHRYFPEEETSSEPKADGFDDFGVGQVRVIKSAKAATSHTEPRAEPRVEAKPFAKSEPRSEPRAEPKAAPAEPVHAASAPAERPDPRLSFNALSDDELHERQSLATAEPDYIEEPEPEVAPAAPSEVLILYVLLAEGSEIKGADLLSALMTLGFKYGDMDIFHRHLDNAGSGAVLFSLANMFNPGTFDIEQMNNVSTRGLSLFMTLPGPGEPLQNFNLMHNAAKKLAEEFGGQVLDGQRSVLTVQTVRHYVDRIREFQRQRLIHG